MHILTFSEAGNIFALILLVKVASDTQQNTSQTHCVVSAEEKDDIFGHLMISPLFPEKEKLRRYYCAKLSVQLIERNFESSFSFSGGGESWQKERTGGQLRGGWDFWSKHGLGMDGTAKDSINLN